MTKFRKRFSITFCLLPSFSAILLKGKLASSFLSSSTAFSRTSWFRSHQSCRLYDCDAKQSTAFRSTRNYWHFRSSKSSRFLTTGEGGADGAGMEWQANRDPTERQIIASSSVERDEAGDDEPGNVYLPKTGISVSDELMKAQMDKFSTELFPLKSVRGVAEIVTTSNLGGFEPLRYIVALSPPKAEKQGGSEFQQEIDEEKPDEDKSTATPGGARKFAMIDVPPFSESLSSSIRSFIGEGSSLSAILVTSRDLIHYDEAPAVYVTRQSDLDKWTAAFPGVEIVMYRLDVPRDCRDAITQRLDGYGPWALDEGWDGLNTTFVETGRPLSYLEWDEQTASKVMGMGETPPDDDEEELPNEELYSAEAIRTREQNKRILALYTPGHTFGSMTFIFPEMEVCCSGYTIPIENVQQEEMETAGAGPAMDYRGYITTSTDFGRQMEEARHVANAYADRFKVVLPARGDPCFLDGDTAEERTACLVDIVDTYDRIGRAYDQLGTGVSE